MPTTTATVDYFYRLERPLPGRDGAVAASVEAMPVTRAAAAASLVSQTGTQPSPSSAALSPLAPARSPLRQLLECAGEAFLVIDAAGRIVDWNPGAEQIFGWSRTEAIGRPFSGTVVPVRCATYPGVALQDPVKTGGGPALPRRLEATGVRRSGEEFPLETIVYPLAPDGTGVVAVWARERTGRHAREQELMATRIALETAACAKDEIVGILSHEIRTPLNTLAGLVSRLLESNLEPAARECAQSVRRLAGNLVDVLDDVLDAPSTDRPPAELDFDVIPLVEAALDRFAPAAAEKGLDLVSCVDAQVPARLRGNPAPLRQVLATLLGNAVTFTERGEISLRVGLAADEPGHVTLRVQVEDTGAGLSAEAQKRLFPEREQDAPEPAPKPGEAGRGLAAAKHLVCHMRGHIGVQSEPGRGARFWFTARFAMTGGAERAPFTFPRSAHRPRVLVIDDNPGQRLALAEQLDQWGLRHGSSGTTAMGIHILRAAAVAKEPFDVVLVDAGMPRINGTTLAGLIRMDPLVAGTHVILMTPVGRALEPGSRAFQHIDRCLAKPLHPTELFEALSTLRPRGK